MPSIDELRSTYRKLPDVELRHIAVFESNELSNDATKVLREEMGQRGLLDDFAAAIDSQRKPLTSEEVDDMIRQVRRLPCQICRRPGLTIHGYKVITHTGLPWIQQKEEVFYIGCANCIRTAARSANTTALASGLLHFPLGVIMGFATVLENRKAASCHEMEDVTEEFEEHVRQNPGEITFLLQLNRKPPISR